MDDRLRILGVRVDHVDQGGSLRQIASFLETPGCKVVITVNPEHVILSEKNAGYRQILNSSELNVPDGVGMILASRILGNPLKERVTGSDLLPDISRLCAEKDVSIFLLGGKPGVAEKAAENLKKLCPDLQIAGTSCSDPLPESDETTIGEINESGARVLAVAYGSPKENVWIDRNRDRLSMVNVAIGVGGAFDFISGNIPRAPHWMRRFGLEWLFRLWQEPSRARRMAVLPGFGLKVLWSKWK